MKKKTTENEERATYKVWEAARVGGVGPAAIRKGVAEGRIPHIKFGRLILIPKAAFLKWLENCGERVEVAAK